MNRIWTLVAMAAVAAAVALVVGFPMTAAGVLAGLPIGIINYVMMYRVRQRMEHSGGGKADMGLMMQRSMLRLLFSVAALLLASMLGPEFLIGALIGIVTEVFSYFKDAMRLLLARKE